MSKIFYRLYDRLLHRRALARAFAKVRRAKGAKTPGVDGQTAADFADNQEDELDRLGHDLIIASFRRRVRDGSILTLLRMFLESGVMIEGSWEATEIGSPQGGVISAMISNVYLDAFDQEMKSRGHRIVRYADDILILCRSQSAAEHACEVATDILEGKLHLVVNQDKTHLVHASRGVKYLGVEIGLNWIRIQDKTVAAFKAKVKALTRRNRPVNLDSSPSPLLRPESCPKSLEIT